jgi:hypothetical protein
LSPSPAFEPLVVTTLDVAGRNLVHDRIAVDVVHGPLFGDVDALLADNDDQLALVIELPGDRVVDDLTLGSVVRAGPFAEEDRVLRVSAYLPQAVLASALVGVLLVVEPDGNDRPLELGDRCQQLYRSEWLGLAVGPGDASRRNNNNGVTRLGDDVLHARFGENSDARPFVRLVGQKFHGSSRCWFL